MRRLFHVDGRLPNLALMRLASHFRARGEEVDLVRGFRPRTLFDVVCGEQYGSSIFDFSAPLRARIEAEWGLVRWGGTGVRVESSLAEIDPSVDWDAVPPDYSLYPGFGASLGFTQRGCRLLCPFCVVPRKEGRPRGAGSIASIWRGAPHPRHVVLLDNDFFGQPRADWTARVEELVAGGFRVCFSQGINLRLVDDEAARALAGLEYRDNDFRARRLYTAWDNLGDERVFKRGVERLRAAGVPPAHLMVYMLVGYAPGETWPAIHHRFEEMVALGCKPYPMVYDRKARPDLCAFQRWAVTGLYRSVPWGDYRDRRLDPAAAAGSTP